MAGLTGIQTEYFPSFGQHDVETVSGDVVSIVSAPDWEGFWETLSTSADLGNVALSPELIVVSSNLADMADHREDQAAKIEQVRELSQDSDTLFALGAPTYGPGGRPSNSLLFIKRGLVVAQANKRYSMNFNERRVFSLGQKSEGVVDLAPLGVLICFDLVGEATEDARVRKAMTMRPADVSPLIGPNVRTVLMSSWWGVPAVTQTSVEDHFLFQLGESMDSLFDRHEHLEEVVIADRSAPPHLSSPINAHYRRS